MTSPPFPSHFGPTSTATLASSRICWEPERPPLSMFPITRVRAVFSVVSAPRLFRPRRWLFETHLQPARQGNSASLFPCSAKPENYPGDSRSCRDKLRRYLLTGRPPFPTLDRCPVSRCFRRASDRAGVLAARQPACLLPSAPGSRVDCQPDRRESRER